MNKKSKKEIGMKGRLTELSGSGQAGGTVYSTLGPKLHVASSGVPRGSKTTPELTKPPGASSGYTRLIETQLGVVWCATLEGPRHQCRLLPAPLRFQRREGVGWGWVMGWRRFYMFASRISRMPLYKNNEKAP